jgi:hypothetical protein
LTTGKEDAVLNEKGGSIVYRFHARDLHLVLARPRRQAGTLVLPSIARAPGESHGMDTDADGQGSTDSGCTN